MKKPTAQAATEEPVMSPTPEPDTPAATSPTEPTPALVEEQPKHGGSYVRLPDGTLERVAGPQIETAPEGEGEEA